MKGCWAAAGQHGVAHGVALLDAQEAFLQRSGAKRVRLLCALQSRGVSPSPISAPLSDCAGGLICGGLVRRTQCFTKCPFLPVP